MPSSSSQRRATARRALIADISADRKGWLQHGIAALAHLRARPRCGRLGVADRLGPGHDRASGGATGRAVASQAERHHAQPAARRRTAAAGTSDATKLKSLADQRAEELAEASEDYAIAASTTSAEEAGQGAQGPGGGGPAKRRSGWPSRDPRDAGGLPDLDASAIQGDGKACLPLASYRIAARFGQVGIWSRYHTGFDFSAGIGTPIRAPSAGVVTNAGIGPASGWAGNYVAIRYPDGTQTLMAHMSTVSVSRRPDRLAPARSSAPSA